MKQFNFLSKSSSLSCGHSSVTLASTVGSPSAHRRGTMLRLISVLVLIFTFGIGQMWGTESYWEHTFSSAATTSAGDFTISQASWNLAVTVGAGSPTIGNGNDNSVTAMKFGSGASNYYSEITLTTSHFENYSIKSVEIIGCGNNANKEISITATQGTGEGIITIGSATIKQAYSSDWDSNNSCKKTLNTNEGNGGVLTISVSPDACAFSLKKIKVVYDEIACANSISITKNTEENATLSLSTTSVETCSGTATNRQVTVSVAPASCYAAPVAASVTWTGTAASKTTRKSGPTWNGSTNKYDYVFEFDKDAAGAVQFNISLSTKTTYTVSYNKGTYGSGDNGSGTKTCGEALTLPNSAMFTREGYTQKGWSTAQTGNTKAYDLGGNYTNNSATTLYPYWEANDCTITWMVNGEEWKNKGGSTTAKYDGKVANLPTAPNTTTDGCGDKFMGWTNVNIEDAVLDKDVPADATTIGTLNCFTDAEHSPTIKGVTFFYAVFAEYVEK